MNAAELAAAEFAAGMTALSRRITPPGGGSRMTIAAISADGRWAYEKEGRYWIAFLRADGGQRHYETSLNAARTHTFETDYPMHGPAREPRPMRFTVV